MRVFRNNDPQLLIAYANDIDVLGKYSRKPEVNKEVEKMRLRIDKAKTKYIHVCRGTSHCTNIT